MKNWKRNAIIAGVLVLVCAGIYLKRLPTVVLTCWTRSFVRWIKNIALTDRWARYF